MMNEVFILNVQFEVYEKQFRFSFVGNVLTIKVSLNHHQMEEATQFIEKKDLGLAKSSKSAIGSFSQPRSLVFWVDTLTIPFTMRRVYALM